MDVRNHMSEQTCTTAAVAPALPPPKAFFDAFWKIFFQSIAGDVDVDDEEDGDAIVVAKSVVTAAELCSGCEINTPVVVAVAETATNTFMN
jgi:hypothetical protein